MAYIVPDSHKEELFEAIHDFTASTGDTFKIALYNTTSGFAAATTTVYNATIGSSVEVTGTGYTATGATLVNISPTVAQNVAFVDFNDVTFTTATITAAAALIYNTSNGSKAVVVLDFGGSKTSTNGDFTIQFPAANSTSAILRIS